MLSELEAKTSDLVSYGDTEIKMHRELLLPFKDLVTRLKKFDIEIYPVSGYRSIARQMTIWNEKVMGKRKVLDDLGSPIDIAQLSREELLFKILRWSMIPGFSRHHWGSDVDVIDKTARDKNNYHVELVTGEYDRGGIFSKMSEQLNALIEKKEIDFFLPYKNSNRVGVGREPWHISYAPLSSQFESRLNIDFFISSVKNSEILLKEEIVKNAEYVFTNFVKCQK